MVSKTVIQCYLMDFEMFVGEQRFIQDFVLKMIEAFQPEDERVAKKAVMVTGDYYVKGPVTVLNDYEEQKRKEEEEIRKAEEEMREKERAKLEAMEDELTIKSDSEDLFRLPGVECILKKYFY